VLRKRGTHTLHGRAKTRPPSRRASARREILDAGAQLSQSLLTDAQLVEVRLAVREAKNGQFATDEEMANLWRKFGL